MSESRIRVLIVDDDATTGDLTRRRLAAAAEVDFQQGAEGALELVRANAYDVILLDLNMPGTSGLSLLDGFKREGISAKVVLFSSMDEDSLAEIARTAGVDSITKSATKDQLIAKITAVRDSQVPDAPR